MEKEKFLRNIILHIPHSSTKFPKKSGCSFHDLNNEERLLIDYYTDELFEPNTKSNRIDNVVFPYCRLFCDVERLINDPLESQGLGISYSRRESIRGNDSMGYASFSTLSEAFNLYADFHAEVAKKIVENNGHTMLIDCHSFSSIPNLLNRNPPSDIDICIGYNDDDTCPDKVVISNIVQHFKSQGYKVGINEPFSNSKTFAVPVKYYSFMIEVNKRLYMNEETLEKSDNFARLHQIIESLYRKLLWNIGTGSCFI